eukprot:TRINITY_DN40365_c0_g1_i1.p1 TRINITY_DN40365_c0_g1~~TRINITY_DN40365_c0_g1_i1.p1  ORF type:complete len:267 (+),score=-5.11 TRINITY_DN40365_c0_g1_i1:112-912(+)
MALAPGYNVAQRRLLSLTTLLALVSSAFAAVKNYDDNPPYVDAKISNAKWYRGSATFYGNEMLQGNSGNCGYPYSFVNNVTQVAVPDPRWTDTMTANVPNFKGAACGQCYEVRCDPKPRYGGKVFCTSTKPTRVRVTNYDTPRSEGWPNNHFDFHNTGYTKIAALESGIVNVMWRRVPCPGKQAKFTVKGNPYFHDINVYDVPGVGAITAVWARGPGDTDWRKARQSWGARYFLSGKLDWSSPEAKVRAQLAESGKYIYPKHVQTT